MQDGGVRVGDLDPETKSLGMLQAEVHVVFAVGVAPDADALLVEDVECDVSQDGMGTHDHTVFRGGQEGDTQFSFVPCDEDGRVVIVVLGVPLQHREAVALGEGAALRRGRSREQRQNGDAKGKALHRWIHDVYLMSSLRTEPTASVIWDSTSSLAV